VLPAGRQDRSAAATVSARHTRLLQIPAEPGTIGADVVDAGYEAANVAVVECAVPHRRVIDGVV
jgi:hypothetical protein